MAYDHQVVINAQYQQLAAERAQALAEYEAGRIAENEYNTMSATNRILEVDQKIMALDRIANTFVASQQQPQGNRFGLTQDQIDIAHNHQDDNMTNEQKEELYARGVNRYKYEKATGLRRDDQGTGRR